MARMEVVDEAELERRWAMPEYITAMAHVTDSIRSSGVAPSGPDSSSRSQEEVPVVAPAVLPVGRLRDHLQSLVISHSPTWATRVVVIARRVAFDDLTANEGRPFDWPSANAASISASGTSSTVMYRCPPA